MLKIFKSKKVLIEIVSFSLALIALTTTTYAWYNIANNLRVNNIEVGSKNPSNFKIGLKNEDSGNIDYYSDISKSDLVNHGQYVNDASLYPVSSMYQSLWLNDFTDLSSLSLYPTFRNISPSFDVRKGEIATKGFYSIEFYFLANHDMYLYLDSSTSLKADREKNKNYANANKLNSDDLNKVEDTMRLSFLSSEGYKIFEPNVDESSHTYFANRLDLSKDGYFDLDSANKEILYGEYTLENGKSLVYDENARIDTIEGNASAFNACSYQSASPLDILKSEEDGLIRSHENSLTLGQLSNQSDLEMSIVHLSSGTPSRVIVSLYEEGWDIDHVDSIMYSSFNVNLVFTALLDYRV